MRFDAFEITLELIRSLRDALAHLERRDPPLAVQMKKAAASIALNLREGRRRVGKDRTHLWRVAAGSADEVQAALLVAEAFGYVELPIITRPLELADRVLAMLWRMTR